MLLIVIDQWVFIVIIPQSGLLTGCGKKKENCAGFVPWGKGGCAEACTGLRSFVTNQIFDIREQELMRFCYVYESRVAKLKHSSLSSLHWKPTTIIQ